MVLDMAGRHERLVTVEEGTLMGGAGSAVLECLAAAGATVPVLTLGLPDVFTDHGDPAKILAALGLDAAGIEASILGRFPELATPAPTRPALAAVG
jgi:1-deoxy-D-xylulose-5-phosphate synthase